MDILTKVKEWAESIQYMKGFQTEWQSKALAEGVYRSAEN